MVPGGQTIRGKSLVAITSSNPGEATLDPFGTKAKNNLIAICTDKTNDVQHISMLKTQLIFLKFKFIGFEFTNIMHSNTLVFLDWITCSSIK